MLRLSQIIKIFCLHKYNNRKTITLNMANKFMYLKRKYETKKKTDVFCHSQLLV